MTANKQLRPSGTTHIVLDDRGRAWVEGTNVRVDQVVADVIGVKHLTPQQILEAYPDSNLTLARVHSAMAWYYDHRAEIDSELARVEQMVEEGRARQRNLPLVQRALGLKAGEESSNPSPQS